MALPAIVKNRKIGAGILLVVIATLSLLIFGGRSENASNYTFVVLTKGNVESTISSTGTLNPVTEVTVGTQVSGTIEKVLVDFNDRVKKGQIIAVLDSALLQMAVNDVKADLLKAEAQFDEAQFSYKRDEQLFTKGLMSESDFQTVKTTLKTAEAGLMTARTALQRAIQNLNYAIIRSPINGTVTARSVEAGQTVAASFSTPTLFTIAQDLSKMEIKASVDESDIGQIKVGQAARFTVQAYPAETFEGKVKQIRLEPTTSSNVVNYTVVVSADNKDNLLLPGMTATVEFVVDHKTDVLVVANSALRFQPSDKDLAEAQKRMQAALPLPPPDSVGHTMRQSNPAGNVSIDWKRLWYLDKDGKLVAAPVQVGISDGANTEILGNHFLAGMKVINGSETEAKTEPASQSSNNGPPPPML